MFAKKMKNFLVQLILTPISFLINLLVLTPVVGLFTGGFNDMFLSNAGSILLIPTMIAIFGLGFVFNRLLFRVKGKKTDETYLTMYTTDVITDLDYNQSKNTLTAYYTTITYPGYATKRTALGWLATFLAFIAFPMRLISLAMAYASLFCSRIFVTHRGLSKEVPISRLTLITHTLFDFVILPANRKSDRTSSIKGIIFVIAYIAAFILLNGAAILMCAKAIQNLPNLFIIILFFLFFFILLSDIILLIKYCILICYDYSVKNAIIFFVKLIAFPIVLLGISIVLDVLPYAQWGFTL